MNELEYIIKIRFIMKHRISSLNEFENMYQTQTNQSELHNVLGHLCLSVRAQMQLTHWQTDNKNMHEDLDEAIDKFQEEMDELIEMTQAEYGIIHIDRPLDILNIEKMSDLTHWCNTIVNDFEELLPQFENSAIQQEITDIIEILTKLKYKLTLK